MHTSMYRRILISAASALALSASFAGAQSVTVGTENGNNCFPFGCNNAPTRYQQVFSASSFTGPITIDSLVYTLAQQFGTPGLTRQATYQLAFSTTTAPVNGLSSNLDANVTGPESVFANFIDGGTMVNSTYTIVGSTPFVYDPSLGNLLLDVTVSNMTGDPLYGSVVFASDDSGNSTSRAYAGYGAFHDQLAATDAIGLVTNFNGFTATTSPEPSSLALIGTGLVGLVPIVRRRTRRVS